MANEDAVIIAALIGAFAGIINTFIFYWLSGRKKDNCNVGDTVLYHTTEYVPIPVEPEKEGWTRSLVFYAKRLSRYIIVILCYVILTGLGAYVGYLFGRDPGEIVGLIIGLVVGYLVVRKI
jgi:hypothetical protein